MVLQGIRQLSNLNRLERLVFAPLALGTGVALGIFTMFYTYAVDTTPPVKFEKVEALNSPITVGEDLLVRIVREKRRKCPVTSLRYATNEDGRAFDIPDRAWSGGPVGGSFEMYYPTSGLPPGSYTLHVSLSYECPGGFTFNVDQPTVKFRVMQ